MIKTVNNISDSPDPRTCAGVQALTHQIIFTASAEALPREAEVHLQSCLDCQAKFDEVVRVDAALSGALQDARREIPGPSTEQIDYILARIREEPQAAKLFRQIRLSVRRMLWLTFLVLSFLLVCGLAWLLFKQLKILQGG